MITLEFQHGFLIPSTIQFSLPIILSIFHFFYPEGGKASRRRATEILNEWTSGWQNSWLCSFIASGSVRHLSHQERKTRASASPVNKNRQIICLTRSGALTLSSCESAHSSPPHSLFIAFSTPPICYLSSLLKDHKPANWRWRHFQKWKKSAKWWTESQASSLAL